MGRLAPLTPSCGDHRAGREEKQVTDGNESTAANQNPEQKQDLLDETHPNTRGR